MKMPEIHFVISAPRSGSTWLTQALNCHPEIFATEQRLFGNFCEMWPNNNGKLAPRITFDAYARAVSVHYFHSELAQSRNEFIDSFVKEYCQFLLRFASQSSGKNIIVDKITPYPGTTRLVIHQISQFFPAAKIIRLIRDGRDVATSGTFDWLLKDGMGTLRHSYFVEQKSDVELQRFFDDETLAKWARNWRETIKDLSNFDLEVRYEDLLVSMERVLAGIFNQLGVDDQDQTCRSCADAVTFEKLTGRKNGQMEPTAKQRSGVCGEWKKYFTARDAMQFHAIAGSELVSTGYAESDSWVHQLPEHLLLRHGDTKGAT